MTPRLRYDNHGVQVWHGDARDVAAMQEAGSFSLAIVDGPIDGRSFVDTMGPNGGRMVEWRDIEGWRGYQVSDGGEVRSFKVSRRTPNAPLPRALAPQRLPSGYLYVDLKDRGARRREYVHALVLEAFVGPRPAGCEAAHGNGDPSDNRAANLRWATPTENNADKRKHGTNVDGGSHYAARLTDNEARAVFGFPGTTAEAAKAFGVSYHIAYCIRTRRTYRTATRGL